MKLEDFKKEELNDFREEVKAVEKKHKENWTLFWDEIAGWKRLRSDLLRKSFSSMSKRQKKNVAINWPGWE